MPSSPTTPISSAPVRAAVVDDDEEIDEGPLNTMGLLAALAAVAALVIALASTQKYVDNFYEGNVDKNSDAAVASWAKSSSEPEGFLKLPADFSPFEDKNADYTLSESKYAELEPAVPKHPADK